MNLFGYLHVKGTSGKLYNKLFNTNDLFLFI